ncbi:MAG: Uma2 family endonuclease [Gammaproteobacteria bacterium]
MGLPLKDHAYHTYGDYVGWPDDVRYELIDGVAYLMAPAPTVSHQEIAGEVFFQTRRFLEGKPCRVLIAPVDVRLPKGDEADEAIDTVVQPDVLVVCDEGKIGEHGVRGAPDWIVEVLSPGTAAHDQIAKRRIYERHAVKEYWLIHPTDRVLTVYRLSGAEYGKPDMQELAGETPVGVLPGLVIGWDALASRLPGRVP